MPATPAFRAPHGLPALLQLADSALPTGAFGNSFGLEAYLESGEVSGEDQLLDWLREYLSTQLALTDAVAIRRSCRAIARGEGLSALDAELGALLIPRQIREASMRMGRRLLEIAADAFPSHAAQSYAERVAEGACSGHFVLAFAAAGAGMGFDEDTLVEAHLHSSIVSLTANAVRAIPLGQLAGQRVISSLRAEIGRAADLSRIVGELDFGAATPALEINQMRHEHQHARMFAS